MLIQLAHSRETFRTILAGKFFCLLTFRSVLFHVYLKRLRVSIESLALPTLVGSLPQMSFSAYDSSTSVYYGRICHRACISYLQRLSWPAGSQSYSHPDVCRHLTPIVPRILAEASWTSWSPSIVAGSA